MQVEDKTSPPQSTHSEIIPLLKEKLEMDLSMSLAPFPSNAVLNTISHRHNKEEDCHRTSFLGLWHTRKWVNCHRWARDLNNHRGFKPVLVDTGLLCGLAYLHLMMLSNGRPRSNRNNVHLMNNVCGAKSIPWLNYKLARAKAQAWSSISVIDVQKWCTYVD